MKRILFLATMWLVAAGFSVNADAMGPQKVLELIDDQSRLEWAEIARVVADPDGRWSIDDSQKLWEEAQPQAHPLDTSVLDDGSGRHWIFFEVENRSQQKRWVLSFLLPSLDVFAVVSEATDGSATTASATGRQFDARSRDFPAIGHHHRLVFEPQHRYRLAILIETHAPPPPNLSELELVSHQAFMAQAFWLNIGIVLSLGILIALGIYMLFLAARVREITYFWFSGYALSTVLIWASHYELIRFLLVPDHSSSLLNYMATAAMVAFVLLFTREFLRISEVAPRVSSIILVVVACALVLWGTLPLIESSALAYDLNAVLAGLALVLIAVSTVIALRAKVPSARLFLVAFSLLFSSASLTVLDALILPLPTATVRLMTVVATALGVMVMALSVANQMHGLKRGLLDAEQLARTDKLTGLMNRGAFDSDFSALVEKVDHGVLFDVTVVYADLDGLKKVNDSRGHQVGDEVLARFAAELSQRLRTHDQVYRIGGDEFVILMPHRETAETPDWLAQRFEEVVAQLHDAGFDEFGVSIGVASLSEVDGDRSEALRLADHRMYESKSGARAKGTP